MSRKTVPPVGTLRQLVRYEPESGKLFWIERDRERFPTQRACSTWNKKFAGAEAFTTPDGQGYLTGKIFRVRESAHRIAFAIVNERWPTGQIDHINGDRTDNRITNLREVQPDENGRNCKRRSDNTSGVTGVRLCDGRYVAELQSARKRVRIGSFDTLEEAAQARKAADREFGFHENHGRSALVDVPVEPVGEVGEMPGSNGGFTMAVFKSSDVPLGTKLYTRPPHRGEDSAEVVTLTRAEADRIAQRLEFDASWDKCGDGYYSIKRQLGTIAATRSASATTAKGVSE